VAPIAIVWPSTGVATTFTVTVHTEWRVNFTDPGMAGTAAARPMSMPNMWQEASNFLRATAGHISDITNVVQDVAGALRGASAAIRPAQRILALGN